MKNPKVISSTLTIIYMMICLYSFGQVPAIQWQNTIGSNGYDAFPVLDQSADGSYYIGCGNYEVASGDKAENVLGYSTDYWVVKLSPTGDILWQNTIGGDRGDGLSALWATSDGGVVLGGSSASLASVDKTESCWLNGAGDYTNDYWVVKLSASGVIEWQNNIGGRGSDILKSIQQTMDGGYIVGGYSNSGSTGDKTEANIGGNAYWIIKLNSTGGIEWQNTIDGINEDLLKSIKQTSDGGYIIGGDSRSGISGEKTEACFSDSYDYWVIKLNSSGGIEWQNTIGGNNDEELTSVDQAADGGYIICGTSLSGITGDKTENKIGSSDYWIVKLNSSGAITWQNTIGGNQSETYPYIQSVSDGGFYLLGTSATNLSADKTVPGFCGGGGDDLWLMKLNSSGNILWQNVYGGCGVERMPKLEQTTDGGLLLLSSSNSDISGNKTENAIPTTYGTPSDDYWVIKLAGTTCLSSTEVCNGLDDNCNGTIDDGVINTASIIATDATTFCTGGSVPLYITYTGNSTLQWKRNGVNIPGATYAVYIATTSGNYACQVTNACGSVLSSAIHVTSQKKPTANITAGGPVVFCAGGSVVLTANSGVGLGYQWLKNAVNIVGATSINYTATTAGNYTCLVTKTATGCNKLSNPVTVTVNCKDELLSDENNLMLIYPNPSTDNIIITLSNFILNTSFSPLTITDLSGKIISEINISSSENEIDISNYPSGIYFVKMIIDDKQLIEKFIKQ